MTYAEYRMQKVADGDEEKQQKNWYQYAKEQGEAGSDEYKQVLEKTPQSAVGWNLLGAGLGAGGGYILSRWLRRNGTKRQRALDMLIGALLGGGGAWYILNNVKGKEGLTLQQQIAVDEHKRELGYGGQKSRPDPVQESDPLRATFKLVGGGAGGTASAIIAGTAGKKFLPNWTEDPYLKSVARSQGVDPKDYSTWLAKEQYGLNGKYAGGAAVKRTDPAIRRHAVDTLINAGVPAMVFGGLGAWGGAEAGDWVYDWSGLGHSGEGVGR